MSQHKPQHKPQNIGGHNLQANQQRVYNISQTGSVTGNTVVHGDQATGDKINISLTRDNIDLDREAANLLDWLASQQGISREIALKKALATATYIYDLSSQGSKLLVQRKDNSVGEIVLK